MHLDAEYDGTTYHGDKIGDKERPENLGLVQNTLQHEADSTDKHHHKTWQRYSVGISRANRSDSLWQITKDEADARHPSTDFINNTLFHSH